MRQQLHRWSVIALAMAVLAVAGQVPALAHGSGMTQSTNGIEVSLTTNRGCGDAAVFRVGEATAFDFSVSRDAYVRLRLQRPGLNPQDLLENFPAQAGVIYRLWGTAGEPIGTRTLTLDAQIGSLSGQATCTYSVQPRVPDTQTIAVDLRTNKGCGANAVFRPGEGIAFDFSVSRDAFVDLRVQGPAGEQLILDDYLARAGFIYRVTTVVGQPGERKLILDARAGQATGRAECAYRVQSSTPTGPINVHLRTNKGCGDEAVFRPGEGLFFEFSVDRSSFVRFTLEAPGGGEQVLLEDFFAHAGVLYRIHTSLARTGEYGIRLDAARDTLTGQAECGFHVRTQ